MRTEIGRRRLAAMAVGTAVVITSVVAAGAVSPRQPTGYDLSCDARTDTGEVVCTRADSSRPERTYYTSVTVSSDPRYHRGQG